jgi:uncharacterized damage-inducible protein DinB
MPPGLNPLFDHLRDLHRHMGWADAAWFQTWADSGFRDDPDLLQRTQHTVDIQVAFLMVLREEDVAFPGDRPAPEFARLRALAGRNHQAYGQLFEGMAPDGLARSVRVPWFPGDPCRVSVADALTQVAMHTQHHRGQLMTRLRQLGGQPQNVDYIIWAWKDRPEARWS